MTKKILANVDLAAGADKTAVVNVADGQEVGVQEVAERKPMAEPEGGWPADEFTGLCGHFVRDPYTGVRSRAPE